VNATLFAVFLEENKKKIDQRLKQRIVLISIYAWTSSRGGK